MSVDTSEPITAPARLVSVLFADDSRSIRTLARFALSTKAGCTIVAEAADGVEALAMYDELSPDCVVLDAEMPRLDGWETLAGLLDRQPEAIVVMLSGSSDPAVAARALAAGAAAYLDKGSQIGQLAETVRRVTAAGGAGTAEGVVIPPAATAVVPLSARPEVAADAELRRLEYVIGHDLTEPLRIIEGFSKLLASRYADSLDDSGRMFVTQLTEASDRMKGMLDDLLVYGRAARLTPASRPVDVSVVMMAVCSALQAAIGESNGDVQVDECPTVRGDPAMLQTVLEAVVSNSLLFNRAARPTVRITGRRVGDAVAIDVTDNGIGIEPAHAERAFDLFQRLNSRDEYRGTGTGLALCRRLMQLQGGSVDLTSTPGAGTTVALTLPACPLDLAQPTIGGIT